MVKIVIENLGQKELLVPEGDRTALSIFQQSGQDWMHACGGKGRCTTCRFIVLEGGDHLGPLTAAEIRYRQQGALRDNERLSCQVLVHGSIRVRVPKDCQLPHLSYT